MVLVQEGKTAIMIAVEENHAEIVRQLLRWGADVNLQDNVSHANFLSLRLTSDN